MCRTRPLAEVGYASKLSRAGGDRQGQWVSACRSQPDLWPPLALGAGLSEHVAHLWSQALALDGGVDETIAYSDAVRDGALVTTNDVADIVTGNVSEHLGHSQDAERTAEAILALPLDKRLRTELRGPLLGCIPADRRLMMEALVVVSWEEQGPVADEVLRSFVAALPPMPTESEPDPSIWTIRTRSVDSTYRDAHERASIRLACGTRSDAELVADHFLDGTIEYRIELRETLRKAGHPDVAERIDRDLNDALAKQRELFEDMDFEGTTMRWLDCIAQLARPGSLSQVQRRRLDELTDLFASARLNWIHPGRTNRPPRAIEEWIVSVAYLGGFALPVVAAQAVLLGDEIAARIEDIGFPYHNGRERPATNWSAVPDVDATLRVLVESIGVVPQTGGSQLMRAISAVPDRARAVPLLESCLETVLIWATVLAATILLACTDESDANERASGWLDDDDAMLRTAAARWWSAAVARAQELRPEFERCLRDDDEGVRIAALSYIHPPDLPDGLRQRLHALRNDERQPWRCRRCGHDNPGGRACSACHVQAPQLTQRTDELLGRSAPEHRLQLEQRARRIRQRR
jgi:hypothetical protein